MANTGTEPEFLTPHFQLYNRLQVILDPILQKIADVEMSKTLRDQLANMPVTLAKDINRKGGLKEKIYQEQILLERVILKFYEIEVIL